MNFAKTQKVNSLLEELNTLYDKASIVKDEVKKKPTKNNTRLLHTIRFDIINVRHELAIIENISPKFLSIVDVIIHYNHKIDGDLEIYQMTFIDGTIFMTTLSGSTGNVQLRYKDGDIEYTNFSTHLYQYILDLVNKYEAMLLNKKYQ